MTLFHNVDGSCLLDRFLKNGLGWEGIAFFSMLFVSFVCLFSWLVFLLTLTFMEFLRRHIVIFILKFSLCSVLRSYYLALVQVKLYVYIENEIKKNKLKKHYERFNITQKNQFQSQFIITFTKSILSLYQRKLKQLENSCKLKHRWQGCHLDVFWGKL